MMENKVLFWHRRDLRIEDNAGLYAACDSGSNVIPLFVFDRHILKDLPKDDARVNFIFNQVAELKKQYKALGAEMLVIYDFPESAVPRIARELGVSAVVTNNDYEPYARKRDQLVRESLGSQNIKFLKFKDHVIFEKSEVAKDDGKLYTVFTPYMRKWKQRLTPAHLKDFSLSEDQKRCLKSASAPVSMPTLTEMGFVQVEIQFPESEFPKGIIQTYDKTRDFPAIQGTTRLSLHLRFGTISTRKLARMAQQTNETYLNELIWRDFYQMIMFHFPLSVNNSFKGAYDRIPWRNNEQEFEAWKAGKTGYPIVDAGMRELNSTGFMHNRVRMITASFLTKHLLIDWRWGERYFAEKLLDFELASNVGGWQWAASSGCDAVPYFRIFNPESQQTKFDPQLKYIKKWVPEFGTNDYYPPIVEHKFARQRAIDTFKQALKE